MLITRKDVTYPHTYQGCTDKFIVMRNDNLKSTLLQLNLGDGNNMFFWMKDDELETLSTMLAEAIESGKPLFSEE